MAETSLPSYAFSSGTAGGIGGPVFDSLDMKSSFTDKFRCAPRCQKPDVVLDETFGKV